jgi:predicted permease
MPILVQDLRYSLRALSRSRAFAITTVLVLALGIGATTAIFSVVHSVLLRPLPYSHPEQLVVALHNGRNPVSPADFLDYQKSARSLQPMAAAQYWRANLAGSDRTETINGLQVSANMMRLLGVDPLLGRSFTADDAVSGTKLLLISHALWQRRFGGDPAIVGRQIPLDQASYTVIGVMPPPFRFAPFWATRAEMWTLLDLSPRLNDRDGRSLRVFARLRPGVTVAQAQSEMDSLAHSLAELHPATNAKLGISVVPLHEKVVGQVRTTLLVLLATVAFVFLIACANVANLTLTRAVARRKEMALRVAIGATRLRLIRMALTEMLCLAIAGGAAGIAIAFASVRALSAMLPPASLPRQDELAIGPIALLFAAAISIAGAILAGIVPAAQAAGARVGEALKDGGRGTTGATGRSTRSILIAAEVALSLVLLAGAGLMIRTMLRLQSVDAGFDPNQLLTLQVSLAGTDFNHDGRRAPVFRRVREELAAAPGVESAAAINHLPIGGDIWTLGYSIEGRPALPPGEGLSAAYRVAMPGYFRAMRIGILEGRDFTDHDDEAAPGAAIINQAMARRRWPGESAIGKRIRFGGKQLTVVGIAKNARQSDWTSEPDDEIYVAYYQRPDSMGLAYLTFVVCTRIAPEAVLSAARTAVSRVDRNLPISEAQAMTHVIADRLWRPRLATFLLGVFAAVALVLAAIGIYGVIAYSVRRRTQEIGIRMALGARAADLSIQVFREGMKPVLAGAAVGLAAALALTRLMGTLLYGITATDPYTFAGVVMILLAVAALANLVPAIRATRVDPLTALRHE